MIDIEKLLQVMRGVRNKYITDYDKRIICSYADVAELLERLERRGTE